VHADERVYPQVGGAAFRHSEAEMGKSRVKQLRARAMEDDLTRIIHESS